MPSIHRLWATKQRKMDPLLCVRNFPSELEDRTGFPLSRFSKGAKQQLPAKQAACLEACMNPAEGVHHWRCLNHPDRKEELQLWISKLQV